MSADSGKPHQNITPDFVTEISRVASGRINVRGYDAVDLMRSATFSEAAYLTIRGCRASAAQLRLFDAILCSCVDHGLVNTLSITARYVASGSGQLAAAISAGILCFGTYTGTSQLTAEMLIKLSGGAGKVPSDSDLDAEIRIYRAKREPVPGFGHPIHKDFDPRTETVREVAESVGLIGPSVALLDRIRERCSLIVGKKLVTNVDGLMAALLLDMGFSSDEILATNILSAIPGIAAHAAEEKRSGQRLRYPADHEAGYRLPVATRFWEPLDRSDADNNAVDQSSKP